MAKKKKIGSEIVIPYLSDTPSHMLRQALGDLKAIEKNKKYKIDMNDWHNPTYDPKNKCHVCLAGAVIARAGNDPHLHLDMENFSKKTSNKFRAIDAFRTGSIVYALEYLDIPTPFGLADVVDVPEYKFSKKKFHQTMNEIINLLEKFDL